MTQLGSTIGSTNSGPLRVVLICDNKDRELASLLLLKTALEQQLGAEVTVIGSLAELQRMYYLIYKIKPHLVVMSQVFEHSCRQLAQYIRQSGGRIAIVPCELRISEAYQRLVKNKSVQLDDYLDYLFLPGKNLAELFKQSNIQRHKQFLTGSPKVDAALTQKNITGPHHQVVAHDGSQLAQNRPSVFFLTSFITANPEFLKQDRLFANQLKLRMQFNKAVEQARLRYQKDMLKLANGCPNLNIVIKPHPLEKTDYTPMLAQAHHGNLYLVKSSLENCLNSIDLAVHWLSTAALECWLHNIPVIEYFPSKRYRQLLPEFSKAHPVAFTYPQLEKMVATYVVKPIETKFQRQQKKILSDNFFQPDGKSAERIATVLQHQLQNYGGPKYANQGSIAVRWLMVMEKVIGVSWSRKLLKLLAPEYRVRYAIDNYTLISSGD